MPTRTNIAWLISGNKLHATTDKSVYAVCKRDCSFPHYRVEVLLERAITPQLCEICSKINPVLQMIASEYKAKYITLVAIDTDSMIHLLSEKTRPIMLLVCDEYREVGEERPQHEIVIQVETDTNLLLFDIEGQQIEEHRPCRRCHTPMKKSDTKRVVKQ